MKTCSLIISICLVGFILPNLSYAEKASRVGVLYTGDPYPGRTPYIHMKAEPMLQVTPIQASRDHYAGISAPDIKRAIRVYMPRTYNSLISTYDVVIISDSNVFSFTNDHLDWFKRGVEDDGLGLVMIGGHETFGTHGGHADWGVTQVGDVLPVETNFGWYEDGKVTMVAEDNVFIKSLPWRPDLFFLQKYASNIVTPKDGSHVLAVDTIGGTSKFSGYENPFFSTWEYPPETRKGRTFAMTGDWTPGGGAAFLRWEYLPDFATNLMLYCSHRPIPQDLDLVHTVRMRLASLTYRRMIIVSLIDFVERFGANPRRILVAVQEFDEVSTRASNLYLEQDFTKALESANMALELMKEAEEISDNVKNEALLWVYLTEWLVVSGTSLICGFGIWSLMIRRRLYRKVGVTTFR